MTANIFGDRFYSLRQPAWHGLGTVSEEEHSAVEAFGLAGIYHIYLENLYTATGLSVGSRAIVRSPVPDDPLRRIFGIVGPEYEMITPLETCSIYDEKVGQPIETVGALGTGETFFLTTKMPSWDIVGDQVDNYLLIVAPMMGGANEIRFTPVRVVCQNTLVAAKAETTQFYRVKHDAGAKDRFSEWLGYGYQEVFQSAARLRELFGFLAKTKVNEEVIDFVLKEAYPDPKPPRQDAPDYVVKGRWLTFEANKLYQENQRSLALQLFQGAGMGQDTVAANGTAWGLWNAITELEDYRGSDRGSNDPARWRDSLFGYRASVKENAYQALKSAFGV